MEEVVGKLWDKWLTRQVSTDFPDSQVRLEDIQSGCPINKAYQYCIVEPLSDEPETIKALRRVISAYC